MPWQGSWNLRNIHNNGEVNRNQPEQPILAKISASPAEAALDLAREGLKRDHHSKSLAELRAETEALHAQGFLSDEVAKSVLSASKESAEYNLKLVSTREQLFNELALTGHVLATPKIAELRLAWPSHAVSILTAIQDREIQIESLKGSGHLPPEEITRLRETDPRYAKIQLQHLSDHVFQYKILLQHYHDQNAAGLPGTELPLLSLHEIAQREGGSIKELEATVKAKVLAFAKEMSEAYSYGGMNTTLSWILSTNYGVIIIIPHQ